MFSERELRDKIALLNAKIGDIDDQAARYNRALTQNEAALRKQLMNAAHDLEMQLPQPTKTVERNLASPQPVDGPFKTFGAQLQAIRTAFTPGGRVDDRLYRVMDAASGLGETVPSDGGFLVQQDFSNQILQSAFETGRLARLCRRIQLSSGANSLRIPGIDETSRAAGSRLGGVRSYWVDEAGEITSSKPKFREIELKLHKLCALIYVTDELLADASALEETVMRVASSEIGFVMDDMLLNGSGSGQPLGISNAGCLVTCDAEGGQGSDTFVFENAVSMWSRLLPGSRRSAVWLVNQNVEPQLYTMALTVGTGGGPVFLPGGSAAGEPYSTLFGRPVIPVEQCQTLGDKGDVYLADFQNGYVLAEKGGIQSAMSIHVRYEWDESVFRFIYRVDGQPILASPVTPVKGSDDLSHFVALAAR